MVIQKHVCDICGKEVEKCICIHASVQLSSSWNFQDFSLDICFDCAQERKENDANALATLFAKENVDLSLYDNISTDISSTEEPVELAEGEAEAIDEETV